MIPADWERIDKKGFFRLGWDATAKISPLTPMEQYFADPSSVALTRSGLAARWAVERVAMKDWAHMDWLPHTRLKAARASRMTQARRGIDRDPRVHAATRAQAL